MRLNSFQQHGFQLIELLIILIIIGILTSICIPGYQPFYIKAYRLEAEGIMMKLVLALEEYQINHDSYADVTLVELGFGQKIVKGNYQLVLSAHESDYVVEAQPLGKQMENDFGCGKLKLDSYGVKMISGDGKIEDCW